MGSPRLSYHAPAVQVDPEALIHLEGKGDGYLRDLRSPQVRRIQVRPLKPR